MSTLPSGISLSPNQKMEMLKQLRAECYSCTLCNLCHNTPPAAVDVKPYVFSSGKVSSKVMLVGQNPGLNEVVEGRPFVGASGRVLDKVLAEVGIDRHRVYITNGVLCYTVNNEMPPDTAVESCKYYLKEQIEIIRPTAIVVMGKSAARSFGYGDQFSVNMCRALRSWKTELHNNVFFTVHPAYTIYSKHGFDILVQTMRLVKELV